MGHNHPSFLNEPSRSDIAKTGRLKRHLSWSL
ncbi:JAB domain-containing protein [Pantoea dispersa]